MTMIQNHKILARYGLRKDFRDTYQKWEPNFSKFLKVASTNEAEVSATTIVGPNRLTQGGELTPITYFGPTTGAKVSAVDKTYKGGFYLSKEAIDDDKYGKLNQGAKWLAEAAQYTKEYAAQGMITDLFTGTNFKGMDGLAMFSTAHTLIGSADTVSNTLSTAVSLSVAGLTGLLDLARKCKNENGDPMIVMPDTLMIANDQGQLQKANQVLYSTLEPFTANNQDNPLKRSFQPTKIIINPYETTNLYRYYIMDSKLNDAHFLEKEAVNMDDWYDKEIDAAKMKARGRWIIWFYDWRGWYGTNPTA